MPSGGFKPYAGVSTAALVFTKPWRAGSGQSSRFLRRKRRSWRMGMICLSTSIKRQYMCRWSIRPPVRYLPSCGCWRNWRGWCDDEIGDLCEIVSGTTPKSNVPEYWDRELTYCGTLRKSEQSRIQIVPPSNLKETFVEFVVRMGKFRLTIQRSLDKLEVLKKVLMQEYFG